MKNILRLITAFVWAVFVWGCAPTAEEVVFPERPGGGHGSESGPDYSYALSNRDLRFESDTLLIDFEAGGVLYSVEDKDVHRFVELATGVTVLFNRAEPSLKINGMVQPVDSCIAIGSENGTDWFAIEPGGRIIVVESR